MDGEDLLGDVAEREIADEDVVRRAPADPHRGFRREPEIRVREHHRLGRAGRPARIDERREIVRLHRRQPLVDGEVRDGVAVGEELRPGAHAPERAHAAAAQFRRKVVVADDRDLRAAVAGDVSRLLGGERRIDRRGDGAGRERSQIGHQPFRPIRPHDGDGVASLDAAADQRPGDAAHLRRRLLPGPFAGAVPPGDPRTLARGGLEKRADGGHGGEPTAVAARAQVE